MQPTERAHDLVLLGATGFVGRLTAARLAADAPAGIRIALAGRSRSRLESLRAELPSVAQSWPLIVCDVGDAAALAGLAADARVLISTVGPYARHGLPVVAACVEAGTDYADLTGETLFVRQSIERFHAAARQTGARIVHSCGFDSVPSDLGVGLNAARSRADGAGELGETVLHVRSMRGGLSGGTIDSLRQQLIDVAGDARLRRVLSAPTALTGGGELVERKSLPGQRSGLPIGQDIASGRWSAPFLMGGYNRQIVLRTGALAQPPYGPDFRYREVVDTGRGPLGAVGATAMLALSTALIGGMALKPTRALLDRLLPDPGQGPSEATIRNGRFAVEVDSTTTTRARFRTTIAAGFDPGYGGTAVMLAQSALELVQDPEPGRAGGVITPMIAFGDRLAERLRECGFTVETERLD